MQCPIKNGDAAELFIAYGSGTLAPSVAVTLEKHLPDCPDCSRMVAAQQAVWSALDQWDPVLISSDFDQKLYARIAEDTERVWYRRFFDFNWSWRPALPAAVACTAIIAAVLLKGPIPEQPIQPALQQRNVDLEQVERALDDIDMLKQLGVVPGAGGQTGQPAS